MHINASLGSIVNLGPDSESTYIDVSLRYIDVGLHPNSESRKRCKHGCELHRSAKRCSTYNLFHISMKCIIINVFLLGNESIWVNKAKSFHKSGIFIISRRVHCMRIVSPSTPGLTASSKGVRGSSCVRYDANASHVSSPPSIIIIFSYLLFLL